MGSPHPRILPGCPFSSSCATPWLGNVRNEDLVNNPVFGKAYTRVHALDAANASKMIDYFVKEPTSVAMGPPQPRILPGCPFPSSCATPWLGNVRNEDLVNNPVFWKAYARVHALDATNASKMIDYFVKENGDMNIILLAEKHDTIVQEMVAKAKRELERELGFSLPKSLAEPELYSSEKKRNEAKYLRRINVKFLAKRLCDKKVLTDYFQTYGCVEDVWVRYNFGFVTFKFSETVKDVLGSKFHEILGEPIHVEPFNHGKVHIADSEESEHGNRSNHPSHQHRRAVAKQEGPSNGSEYTADSKHRASTSYKEAVCKFTSARREYNGYQGYSCESKRKEAVHLRKIFLEFPDGMTFTREDITSYFSTFGHVEKVILLNKFNGRRECTYVSVIFKSSESVKAILYTFPGPDIHGSPIFVKPYRPS